MAAFAVDLNRGYEQLMINQGGADMAALGAATAYRANPSNTILLDTARDIAVANGLGTATVTAIIVNGVPSAGSKSVRVTVTTPVSISIGRIFGSRASYAVGATALASLSSTVTPACIIGLAASGNAIETQGGATIQATDCTIQAVGSINNGGTAIRAKEIVSGTGSVINSYGTLAADKIAYAGSFTNPSWNSNVPGNDRLVRQSTTIVDPLASSVDLGAARGLIGTFVAPRALANPSTPAGANWDFSYSPSSPVSAYRVGTSASYLVPAGTYTIGSLSVAGGISVTFAAGSSVTIAGGVNNGGSALTFGSGTYRINGGFNGGSSGVSFGGGSVEIGSGNVYFAGTNRFGDGPVTINAAVHLNGGTSVTMGAGNHAFGAISVGGGSWLRIGNGNLDVSTGIVVGGGSTAIAGTGAYAIGRNSSGNSIELNGSANLLMGDGLFSANGNITTQGGSQLVIGKTANHLINGNLAIAGSVLFGAGRYTIAGDFANGTGGTLWPYTSPINSVTYGNTLEGVSVSGFGMAGVNVTFILSGTLNLGGGVKTKLLAPGTGTTNGALANILLDSLTGNATNWGGGAENLFGGAVHLPNSVITTSGGAATLPTGQCFMLIANRVIATGGATAGAACPGVGSTSGGGTVMLIG